MCWYWKYIHYLFETRWKVYFMEWLTQCKFICMMITLTVWVDTTVMYENRYAWVLIRPNSCFIQVSFLQLYTMLFIEMFFWFKYYYYEKFTIIYCFICCGSTKFMDNSTIIRDFWKGKGYKMIAGCLNTTYIMSLYLFYYSLGVSPFLDVLEVFIISVVIWFIVLVVASSKKNKHHETGM